MWLNAGSYLLSVVLIGLFVRVAREVHEPNEDASGIWAGLALPAARPPARPRLPLEFHVRLSLSRCSLPRSRCSPTSSTTGNPRVAGFLFAVIGAGQVVGSLLAFRLVTRVRPMRLASLAVVATAAPLWLLVPHLPLAVVGFALAICGASIPLINAPYLGMLTIRVPKALRAKVLQSLLTINQVSGPLGYVVAGTLFVPLRAPRHLPRRRGTRDVREPQLHPCRPRLRGNAPRSGSTSCSSSAVSPSRARRPRR